MGNWENVELGSVCEVVRGGSPRPIIDYITDDPDGVNWLKIGDVKETDKFFTHAAERIKRSGIPKTREVHAGDLILSNSMSFGRAFITLIDGYIHDGWLRLRCNEERLDKEFLYYFLTSNLAQNQFKAVATGSVVNNLKSDTVKAVRIDLPPLEEQRRIAAMLSMIDAKIKCNEEINENLEQQALALFRHYFMDYEPYGGSAPADWTEVSLDDVCTRITDGSHYSPADAPDAPYPMYSVKDMETYGFNSSSCKHITEEEFHKMQKNDCVPRLNDILVAKDGSYLKEIFICSEEKDEAILSSIAIFRPNTEIIMPEILLYLLKQPSVRKDVGDNYVSGSALPRIVLKDFKKYTFLLPPMVEQLKIGSVLHAIRMQTKANIDEIQSLSTLRDTLLPRLMSGELDVSNIES